MATASGTDDRQEGTGGGAAVDDSKDMQRMALSSDLRRRFSVLTLFGFGICAGATWEYALVTSLAALTNGGSGGVIWMFVVAMLGIFAVILSLAEMASMAPASAGQYHWVSEFAPFEYQKIASYGVGWFTALGWQASVAGNTLIIAQQIQALAVLLNSTFDIPAGFNYLILAVMIATALLATAVNIYAMELLPALEMLMLMVHTFGFLGVILPLWILGERTPADQVFFDFQDSSGWGNIGLATLIGILGPTVTLVGGDNASHLGEETRNASKAVPLAMTATATINFLSGFVMTITILTFSGNFDEKLGDRIGQPYLAVIYAATGSLAATVVVGVLIILTIFFCAVNVITTSSRQLFAFSRDRGVPGSVWLSKVNPHSDIPVNALLVTFTIAFLLSFVAASSTTAFNNIISISLVGLLLSYGSSSLTILVRRYQSEPLPPAYFRFSKTVGTLVNGFALCFCILAFVFIFFPTAPDPTPASMNWSILIAGAVVLFAVVWYLLKGKDEYVGPVVRMRRADQQERTTKN